MSRLMWMAAAVLAAAALAAVALKEAPPESGTLADEPARVQHSAAVELIEAGMVPYRLQVPKDSEVHLVVRCAPNAIDGVLTLTGYEDQVGRVDVGPGVSRELVFVADRPGDDFAFVLGDRVLGRLHVTGSHMEADHR